MSFEDELSARMKAAAEEAGSTADAAAAAKTIKSSAASTGAAATLRIVGGLAAAGLVAGALLGATVLCPSAPDVEAAAQVDVHEIRVYDCPDGELSRSLHPGDRVYVIGRNETADWSAFRDPAATNRVLWLPNTALIPDAEAEVPVVECSEPLATSVAASTTTVTNLLNNFYFL